MIIHVVKQGETMGSIAELYGRPVERLILENGITDPNNLAVGETLVILFPQIEYTVQAGDSLYSIAKLHNISIMELLRNNPYLSDRANIYPGEVIVIKYMDEKIREISTNGFVYPFVNMDILKKTLPFLTYLTVYSYYYTSQGDIMNVDDSEIIQTAKNYGVAPIMMLVADSDNQIEEIEILHNILIDQDVQDIFISNLLTILLAKGYYGVNIKTPYIKTEDRALYVNFIDKLSTRLHAAGFMLYISLSMSTFELLSSIFYDELQYDILGQSANGIILITYEAGFSFGISPAVVAFETFSNYINIWTKLIPSQKIVTGLSTISYIWKLPYIEEVTLGQSMSYDSAVALAREVGAVIQYDEVTKSSYFRFILKDEYVVRFRDARGVEAILSLVPSHDLNGTAIWNCMFFYNQMWLIINSQYEITKIVPVNHCVMNNI